MRERNGAHGCPCIPSLSDQVDESTSYGEGLSTGAHVVGIWGAKVFRLGFCGGMYDVKVCVQ